MCLAEETSPLALLLNLPYSCILLVFIFFLYLKPTALQWKKKVIESKLLLWSLLLPREGAVLSHQVERKGWKAGVCCEGKVIKTSLGADFSWIVIQMSDTLLWCPCNAILTFLVSYVNFHCPITIY